MILDIVVRTYKRHFITGALANRQAQANVTRLARQTVKAHARAGHWLFLTRDTHPDNYLATREGHHLPGALHRGRGRLEVCARAGERAGRYRARGLPHRQQAHLWQLYAAERDP